MSADPSDPFEGATGLLAEVGNTPLFRLHDAVADLVPPDVEVHVKAEWFNPGGSVKDRPALSMVLDAERRGRLHSRGQVILDASSGNTGIAYAMIAAARGYRLRLCLPKNANAERKMLLQAYGTEIVYTSPLEGSDGAIRKARELAAEDPELVYLDQYNNPANWGAHFGSTGPEIWAQTEGRVSHFVSCLGTSGTFMGTSRFLQPKGVTCIEVQPDSPFHGLEGLKHMETAIVPGIYDQGLANHALGAPTEASFEMVRRLSRREGLLVGPSAGAAVWAAVQIAKDLGGTGAVIVAMLPDSGERYVSEAHIWEDPS